MVFWLDLDEVLNCIVVDKSVASHCWKSFSACRYSWLIVTIHERAEGLCACCHGKQPLPTLWLFVFDVALCIFLVWSQDVGVGIILSNLSCNTITNLSKYPHCDVIYGSWGVACDWSIGVRWVRHVWWIDEILRVVDPTSVLQEAAQTDAPLTLGIVKGTVIRKRRKRFLLRMD
jgi:hypothetical protein